MALNWIYYLVLLVLLFNEIEILQGHKLTNYLRVFQVEDCSNLKKVVEVKDSLFDAKYHIFNQYSYNLSQCIEQCCQTPHCNGISFSKQNCIGLYIPDGNFLIPLSITHQKTTDWPESLSRRKRSAIPKEPSLQHNPVPCKIGSCPPNEYCNIIPPYDKGTCTCVANTTRNATGTCVSDDGSPKYPTPLMLQYHQSATENPIRMNGTSQNETLLSTTASALQSSEAPRQLVVNVNNKTIELKPGSTMYENWATLSAYAIGDIGSNYSYKWTLVENPKNDQKGSVKDVNTHTMALKNLVVGVYQYKVEVSAPNAFGEAVGNITIIPAKHRNEPPVARISPSNLTVTLPNSAVILDGSDSSDDNEIKSFHWEIVMGPIEYKLANDKGRTLELNDLIAGNYTIMLVVKDNDDLKGNATAVLSVVKGTDYPPTANAGGDKVIYLPIDNIILNGTLSSDDHGIKEWEWTKGPEDSGNAVDMQFTRTPLLQLSNLEEGHYHFILKVVDTSRQSATSAVHVYVHSSLDNLPIANAGKNITLIIPTTNTVLDGSESTGLSPVTHYLWKQLSGPKMAKLQTNNTVKVNVTDLTKGQSVFQLTVWNDKDSAKNSTANVTINVVQEKNVPPVANAGQDFKVTLPTSAVIVNGSQSKDDVAITKWLWRRDDTSLAAGNVIESSYTSPVLIMTNVVPGRYVWNLTVWDDQGASSSDTASIIVENPPYHMDQVEVVVGVGVESLSEAQKKNLIQKLQLLYSSAESDDVDLHIEDIRGIPLSGTTSVIIVGRREKLVISGTSLARQLRVKILNPSNPRLIDLPIITIDTIVCQNNCSGHGECVQASRQCRCNSWWMESMFRRHFGDGVPNCDWSFIYVFIGSIGSTLVAGILIWLAFIYGKRKCRNMGKGKSGRYLLLDNHEETRLAPPRSMIDSDSESESEILFDARKSRGSKPDKRSNGHLKMQRIRT